jgi:hypothetical protein
MLRVAQNGCLYSPTILGVPSCVGKKNFGVPQQRRRLFILCDRAGSLGSRLNMQHIFTRRCSHCRKDSGCWTQPIRLDIDEWTHLFGRELNAWYGYLEGLSNHLLTFLPERRGSCGIERISTYAFANGADGDVVRYDPPDVAVLAVLTADRVSGRDNACPD